ncbi:hypothetical protein [Bacillus kwashiorkori]|uniref:hypothetical protein n=1 Tax=Bacillus kwashiorkori TaxID=1522318 RepID=UPI0007810BD7|nr:hypothetical protein [Bacillus kwashiorkori]
MARRVDLLTNAELTEVRKLQIRMLQSNSISKTKMYEKEIRDIVRDAEKRYFDLKDEQEQDNEVISRLQGVRRKGKTEGILEVVQALLNDGMSLQQAANYTPYDVSELELLLKQHKKRGQIV